MSLGRGLNSLIPPKNSPQASATTHAASPGILEVPVKAVKANPYQPRRDFDHWQMEDLVRSIKEHGILQPLIVTQEDDTIDEYQLIAGERRLKASRLAGLKTVPVIVKTASALEKLELALIENIQRSDLNPIEKAEGYNKLLDEFGLTQEEAAKKVGIPRSSLANNLRLLSLPAEIQKGLAELKISEGHAKVLLGLASTQEQLKIYQLIIQQDLSVHQLEQLLRQQQPAKAKKKRTSGKEAQVTAWEDELREKLQTHVKINKKGDAGHIKIDFYSPAELVKLIKKIS